SFATPAHVQRSTLGRPTYQRRTTPKRTVDDFSDLMRGSPTSALSSVRNGTTTSPVTPTDAPFARFASVFSRLAVTAHCSSAESTTVPAVLSAAGLRSPPSGMAVESGNA